MSEPLLLHAAPSASADLFHAIPLDIIDPFLYVELDDRRFAVNGVLERDRIEGLGLGIEVIDPFELGLDELLNAGVGFLEADLECDLRACRQIGLRARDRAARLPARVGRPAARASRSSCASTATPSILRRRVKTAAQLRRHPPRPGPPPTRRWRAATGFLRSPPRRTSPASGCARRCGEVCAERDAQTAGPR